MIILDKQNLSALVATGTHLVDFYADWCGPCKMLVPVLESLDEEMSIIKVNVDTNSELANLHRIMSVPTLMFFKDGRKMKEITGFHSKEEIQNLMNEINKSE